MMQYFTELHYAIIKTIKGGT